MPGHAPQAAKQRRERQLRQWMRHERMTVATVPAPHQTNERPRRQATLPSKVGTEFYAMSEESGEASVCHAAIQNRSVAKSWGSE